jgi:Excalibur calcium-binding domain
MIKVTSSILLLLLIFTNPTLSAEKTLNSKKLMEGVMGSDVLKKFKNCKEAKAAGVSNVPVSPGYTPVGWRRSADADKDGVACEKK